VKVEKEFYNYIGSVIKEHRERAGLTQSELARRVGVTRYSIANIEKGRQGILLHTLRSIADSLGIPIRLLLPSDSEPQKLICSVCEFDYFEVYGEVCRPILEAEHLAGSQNRKSTTSKIANGLFICGNCQKLYSFYPNLTFDEFRRRVRQSKRTTMPAT
jgi:transcriptional regulator with XRE-family HTH domain